MMGAGDLMCQTLVSKGKPVDGYDWHRAGRMAGWGLLLYGPLGHGWYTAVDKMVKMKGAQGTVAKVLQSVAVGAVG